MRYSRQQQWQFLEDELKAEVKEFDDQLKTIASFLMEKGEVFTAQFLSFSDSGEMIVRFSASRPIPRKGEYLYCMTLHKELRNHKNWGNRTYGDLIKDKTNQTETVCNWTWPSDDPKFVLAGFVGIDCEFARWIADSPKVVLVMGPNKPPYEYIAHLQLLTQHKKSLALNSVLDINYQPSDWNPILLNNKHNIPSFLQMQLNMTSSLILNGPPGTGKTFHISQLVANLCTEGFSVLVTALTNRALMEIAKKGSMGRLLEAGKVYKTKITTDENKEVPHLRLEKNIVPKKGCVILSTFYITSGVAADTLFDYTFDYVVMDEASQALLPMIGASKMLGAKTLFVGDIKQLPPVVQLKNSKITERNYSGLIEGLRTITDSSIYPTYQLTESYRLTDRGTKYTGEFYGQSLKSRSDNQIVDSYGSFFLNNNGGPTLLKTDMEIGDLKDETLLKLTLAVVDYIHKQDKKCEIAVLTCMKETVRALQSRINSRIKSTKILIDTVARVQGLTTDICIYAIPNTHYLRSLEPRLFNVATSRARRQTIIIADKEIMGYSRMNADVRRYLDNLNQEFSFYLPSVSSPTRLNELSHID
jgi:DNA replication ATP-dependent helicase Dna2